MLTIRTTEKGIYVSVDGKQEMAHPLGSLRYTCTSTSVRFFPDNGYEGLYEGRYGDNFTVNGEPVTKENAQTLLEALFFLKFDPSTKQDTLVSGENIKKVNGIDVLGNGNIVINPTIMDLKWTTNVATTRKLVPAELRSKGVKIAYRDNESVYHVEQYQAEAIDDASWENDSNWKGCRTPMTPLFLSLSIRLNFNDETGYYEYINPYDNFSIKDLTEADMQQAYITSMCMQPCNLAFNFYNYDRLAKNVRFVISPFIWMVNITLNTAFYSSWIEVIDFNEGGRIRLDMSANALLNAFNSSRIKRVYGDIECDGNTSLVTNENTFGSNIERVHLKGIKVDINFVRCSKINYDSIRYLIDNASNISPITITVHPTTYGYLTGTIEPTPEVGGTKEEWMQIVTDAQTKQITFATGE